MGRKSESEPFQLNCREPRLGDFHNTPGRRAGQGEPLTGWRLFVLCHYHRAEVGSPEEALYFL